MDNSVKFGKYSVSQPTKDEWPKDKLGYVKLIDAVPTLCYLMHIDPPRQARGSVLYELMEEERRIRQDNK